MAFTQVKSKIPATIGDISVVIVDHKGDEPGEIYYEVQVLQVDGSLFKLAQGNLVPHLEPGQIAQIQTFMATIRVLAQALLPK